MYTIDNQIRVEELEGQNRDLQREIDDLQYKFDNEKVEREKVSKLSSDY